MPYTIKAFGRYWKFGKSKGTAVPEPEARGNSPPDDASLRQRRTRAKPPKPQKRGIGAPTDPFVEFIETLPDVVFPPSEGVPNRPVPGYPEVDSAVVKEPAQGSTSTSPDKVMTVACPICGASIGEPCASKWSTGTFHIGRIRLVNETLDQQLRQFPER